jgi:hypothetical protein
MEMGEMQLGRLQFRIMQVLWDRGRTNAREITEAQKWVSVQFPVKIGVSSMSSLKLN